MTALSPDAERQMLSGLARAQGAMSALQAALGTITGATVEAEGRVRDLERENREFQRQLDVAQGASKKELRAAYRRGYSTGHTAGRTGRASDPEGALNDPRNALRVVA